MGDPVEYKKLLFNLWKKAVLEGLEISAHEGYISIKNDLGECCIVEID